MLVMRVLHLLALPVLVLACGIMTANGPSLCHSGHIRYHIW